MQTEQQNAGRATFETVRNANKAIREAHVQKLRIVTLTQSQKSQDKRKVG